MRLLMLGTGGMARLHVKGFNDVPGVEIVAAVDTDAEKLAEFLALHGIPRGFATLDEALAWGEFDAVTNITPDRVHYPTTMQLLDAGKHVFCEKPLATDHAKALEMTEKAEALGLANMVNLTYRNVPQLQKAHELIKAGAIGKVKHIEASYLQSWLISKAWGDWRASPTWLWRLSTKHGSNGVLGDVGIHILDFASYAAGCDYKTAFFRLQTFDKAENHRIGEYDLDANDTFVMTAEMDNGAMAAIHATRWGTGHLNDLRLRIYGEQGAVEVTDTSHVPKLMTCLGDDVEAAKWTEVAAEPTPTNYARFAEAVRTGVNQEPSFRHAADLQKIIDLAAVTERDRTEHAATGRAQKLG
ncbi:MAG: Gfo/Idh/MocA family oxidoreductase [Candidatus Devosia phytovorans]|uniref:Gfo/Idh/MocA family oxidoreductase n=1 Tax=Candidatus Devosia phytovorans TaxID=3121372 RepID=A0AAJ5VXE7_9HYPH|nr:Gfo/Idh/MocA family oxidoreductase [Devosia sp.]WEK05950.1 MAG: Gfo/Idh/MocA family oxidoreductase [Devosia sp.]